MNAHLSQIAAQQRSADLHATARRAGERHTITATPRRPNLRVRFAALRARRARVVLGTDTAPEPRSAS